MQTPAEPELDPASFPVGTEVGPWRVERWGGRGTYALASPWRPRLIALTVGVLVMMGSWWLSARHPVEPLTAARKEKPPETGKGDGDAVGLGDEAPAGPVAAPPVAHERGIRKDIPGKLFNGQR